MRNYNAKNERIKREYFILLRQADQLANDTVDGIRKALSRFETFTGLADFSCFDKDQAIGFKLHMSKQTTERTGKLLSPATIYSTIQAVSKNSSIGCRDNMDSARGSIRRTFGISICPGRKLLLLCLDVRSAIRQLNKYVQSFCQPQSQLKQICGTARSLHSRCSQVFVTAQSLHSSSSTSIFIGNLFPKILPKSKRSSPNVLKPSSFQLVRTWSFSSLSGSNYLKATKLYGNDDPLFPRTKVVSRCGNSFSNAGLEPVHWLSAGQIREIFKKLCANAGIAYFNPHSLRDTLTIFGEQVCQTPEAF